MSDRIRVRYAPSPTGFLHIGNARTALFNYLFARHYGGDFIIRIEDTDKARHVETGEESQLENLKWLGLSWDEGPDVGGEFGPYRQSERQEIYEPLIQKLLDEDKAYYCYCTPEELEAEREAQLSRGEMPHYGGRCAHLTDEQRQAFEAEGRQPTVRIRTPKHHTYCFNDMVKGEISFESESVGGDWVIVKRDGTPTYNFAVAVDDHYMEVTHVLRGDDHISNTPKQMLVYDSFGWEYPRFGHMTLITNPETGKKLSKRDVTILQFIEDYRDMGYMPEALFNFIALLGWSPKGEEELFTPAEFIEIFDYHRLSTSPAAFDNKKLNWIANQYMQHADQHELTEKVIADLQASKLLPNVLEDDQKEKINKLVALYQEQMSYVKEFKTLAELFFDAKIQWTDASREVLAGETVLQVLENFKAQLEAMDELTAEAVQKAIKTVQKETGVKGRNLYMPIRVATTGQQHGPELPLAIELLGKEKVLAHLDEAMEIAHA
ncbi:glutamate--tRNA ligase [Allofustis seminis]|uniref:glutamate--tRNA ligase n=1 Tax=Allofustis seminis TaxID=166939 RepID=UPI000363B932|nr:glutamate--tRNA ligase [Allofustis seminis]